MPPQLEKKHKPAPKLNICWSCCWPVTSNTSICCVLVPVYAVFFPAEKEEGGMVLWFMCHVSPHANDSKTCVEMKRHILYMAKEDTCCWHGEREAILSSLIIWESSVTRESMKDLIVSQMPSWFLVCTLKSEAQKVKEVLEMKHKMALSHVSLSSFVVPSSFD